MHVGGTVGRLMLHPSYCPADLHESVTWSITDAAANLQRTRVLSSASRSRSGIVPAHISTDRRRGAEHTRTRPHMCSEHGVCACASPHRHRRCSSAFPQIRPNRVHRTGCRKFCADCPVHPRWTRGARRDALNRARRTAGCCGTSSGSSENRASGVRERWAPIVHKVRRLPLLLLLFRFARCFCARVRTRYALYVYRGACGSWAIGYRGESC
jgi:hypothetical protein